MQRLTGCQRGFSLIEVIVAIGVLAVGMLGVTVLFQTAMNSQKHSFMTRTGDSVACEEVEWLKAQAVDAALTNSNGSVTQYYFVRGITGNYPVNGIDRVDITVGWGGNDCDKDHIDKCKQKTTITNFVMRSSGS